MAPESRRSHGLLVPVWWSLGFGGLTTLGLGVLAWGLLIAHALMYGTIEVIGLSKGITAPESNRYLLAFAVGAVVNLAGAPALIWLAVRTRVRSWPPVVLGLAAALVAAVAAACALLLVLGLNPVEFVVGV